jgi:hypothetical protein
MKFNKISGIAETLAMADKSAVGAINRPLRFPGYFVKLHHCAPTRLHRASVTGIDVRSLMQVKRWQQLYHLLQSGYRTELTDHLTD